MSGLIPMMSYKEFNDILACKGAIKCSSWEDFDIDNFMMAEQLARDSATTPHELMIMQIWSMEYTPQEECSSRSFIRSIFRNTLN